jgi:hypothetical protein
MECIVYNGVAVSMDYEGMVAGLRPELWPVCLREGDSGEEKEQDRIAVALYQCSLILYGETG